MKIASKQQIRELHSQNIPLREMAAILNANGFGCVARNGNVTPWNQWQISKICREMGLKRYRKKKPKPYKPKPKPKKKAVAAQPVVQEVAPQRQGATAGRLGFLKVLLDEDLPEKTKIDVAIVFLEGLVNEQ